MATGPKPTRQQVVEAILSEPNTAWNVWSPKHPKGTTNREVAEEVANILVKAGLVEEPREPGWYWVIWREGEAWKLMQYMPREDYSWATAANWPMSRTGPRGSIPAPAIIGPRVTPPEE